MQAGYSLQNLQNRPPRNAGSVSAVGSPHVEYLAHHWILLAGPAFLPAVVVVGVVLYVAMKDRRSANQPGDSADREPARGPEEKPRQRPSEPTTAGNKRD